MDIGGWELAIVAVVILVFFGGKKLPEMARGLGSAKREFENATKAKPDDADAKTTATAKAKAVSAEASEAAPATDAAEPAASKATADTKSDTSD